ncbi:OB-fold nucleic acid binding domain-containing protein [Archaeoglobus veneficus]|uniref:Nucleic acid binding OB-fold tRNA/helicase-type n=1 Tax=Archaeoglobus veneficus (strain DSM 11195 / SNP6) TaxID=693661 RepID=F2KSK4_ARCVS|nr:OB-fold nucleic acid binding domain-containing protein [Archaeoglobus veneficus]AEA48074.1 nucleic acid binding OB-fold tRNA/helicase-type [Archaeoglobus veneficus SNP6]
MDIDEVIKSVGVSREEFEKRVNEIKEHFSGLISEETAVMLAAYSFGYAPANTIAEIGEKRGVVTVEGVVENVSVRTLPNGDYMAIVSLKDNTGRIRVVLWNEAAYLARTGDIGEGDSVRIRGFAKLRNGQPELSVRSAGDIVVVERGWKSLSGTILAVGKRKDGVVAAVACESGIHICVAIGEKAEQLSKFEKGDGIKVTGYSREGVFLVSAISPCETGGYSVNFTPISKLKPLQHANVRGRVSGIGELRKVKDRLLAELYISDETGRIRLLLWDDNVTVYRQADVGDLIEAFNCFPKIGWDGEIEVHCGRSSVVSIEKL